MVQMTTVAPGRASRRSTDANRAIGARRDHLGRELRDDVQRHGVDVDQGQVDLGAAAQQVGHESAGEHGAPRADEDNPFPHPLTVSLSISSHGSSLWDS
jgi:hypothetical protein